MNQIELHENGIKALRAFNGAIATSRLYPHTAPQVSNAIEHGYKGVNHFLNDFGNLEISLRNKEPFLGGMAVAQETLDSFPNLIVYRQMVILGVTRLLFQPSMDLFAFGQIISVFNAKAEKIEKSGGGLEYITGLGLISYFPTQDPAEVSSTVDISEDGSPDKKLIKVEPELLACLCGRNNQYAARVKLRNSFEDVDKAVDIVVAAIGQILRDLQKRRIISRSDLFPQVLDNSEKFIEKESRSQVVLAVAQRLVNSLKEPALCVVLAQNYPPGFGREFYDAQVALIDTNVFGNIIALFREQLAKAKLRESAGVHQVKLIDEVLSQLLDTEKGRHFLGLENAKTVLLKGEELRKKLRIEAGIRRIAQGDFTPLQSGELLEYIPTAVRQMVGSTDGLKIEAFLQKLISQIHTSGTDSQSQLMNMLAAVTEDVVLDRHWYYVDMLVNPLSEWVKRTEESDEPFERVVTLLQMIMQRYWETGKKSQGDAILSLFYQIRSGELKKSSEIETIVGRIQDRGIQRTSLPELLNKWLSDPNNEELSKRLVLQGPVALRFLVESLIMEQESNDRYTILDLLIANDHFVSEVVLERLHEHMEWYGKRNLLKLLAATGGEGDAEAALPYLNHDDYRVQRGAFICINKIGGKNRKRLFLAGLADSSELIKIQIINALVRFCDPEVASHLATMLMEYDTFSEENREPLLVQLLDTLGKCPCPVAVKGVENFLKMRSHRLTKKISSTVWEAAEKATRLLQEDHQKMRKLHVQASQLRKNAIRQAVKRGKTSPTQRVISGLAEEQAIRMLLNKGEEEKARKQLVELIEHTAQTRNFVQAEKLKEWLIDINETALGDIIRAAESISDKKADSIDTTHVEIWNELYEFLTTEEFSAVYHSLQHKKYTNEEMVVHQGALQTALYFVNSGKVKLFFQDSGNRVLVKTMGKGEIIGTGSFFDASVWTISVASVGTTDMSILRLEKMQQWKDELPGLESKLRDYCTRFESVGDIIEKSSQDRRDHERHKTAGRITTVLLDNSGQTTGVSSEAEIFDISRGGVSYLLKTLGKENSRLILGRKVKVILPGGKKPGQQIGIVGDILAVRENKEQENNYSVHVKFESALSSLQLKEILLPVPGESQNPR